MDNIKKEVTKKHTVTLNFKESIAMTAVKNVISFDDKAITVELEEDKAVIEGENLSVENLDTEKGELYVKGSVRNLRYVKTLDKKSFLKKVFK